MPYSIKINEELVEFSQLKTANKTDVLKEIVHIVKNNPLLDKYTEEELYHSLLEREKAGTTGFGKGIAIPHCRLKDLDAFVIGAIVYREGADFESMDGAPVQLVFFIFGPEKARSRHIQVLSELSKTLLNKGAFQELVFAKNKETFIKIFNSYFTDITDQKDQEYRMIYLAIQKEEYFESILQELSGIVKGNLIIVETDKASSYFHALPLFSSYWNESGKGFNRLILAISEKEMVNEIARRINLIVDDLTNQKGVLMMIQPLSLVLGSIDF